MPDVNKFFSSSSYLFKMDASFPIYKCCARFFFLSSVPPLQVSRKRTKCFFLVLVYGRPYMLGNVVVVSRTLTKKKKSWVNLFVAAGLFVGRRLIAENQKVINTLEKKKTVVVVATMKAEKEIKVMEVSLAISAMFGIRN